MARFNTKTAKAKVPTPRAPITVATTSTTKTALGAPGYTRDTKGELFLLGVANMVGRDAFHEKAGVRDERFEKLVHSVALADPKWLLDFVGWLRNDANMRTASLIAGLEGAAALHGAGNTDGWARKLVSAPLSRPDEPGEALAYWMARYGRKLPKPLKRGIADAVRRLHNEGALLKYDTASHAWRWGDVAELVHPKPRFSSQSQLFKHAIDRRHGRDDIPDTLTRIWRNRNLREKVANGYYAGLLDSDELKAAGMTWEDVLSLAGDKVPKKALWEALIPTMNLMAQIRNLRNFDQAGVDDATAQQVIRRLVNPAEIARSRQFPFRFLAAYRHAPSLRWAYPLEQALSHSLANVPALPGRTLILVDQSPSMFPGPYYAGKSVREGEIGFADQAKIFGTALALRAESADLVQYGQTSKLVPFSAGESMLKVMERFSQIGGTLTPAALEKWYAKHDRVVIITDEQTALMPVTTRWGTQSWGAAPANWMDWIVPSDVPVYTWNLAGYKTAHAPGTPNRHWLGGLTDQAFKLIPILESGRDGTWPWEDK